LPKKKKKKGEAERSSRKKKKPETGEANGSAGWVTDSTDAGGVERVKTEVKTKVVDAFVWFGSKTTDQVVEKTKKKKKTVDAHGHEESEEGKENDP